MWTDLDPRLRLVFTHILGWTQGAEVRNLALSLGERVAIPHSRESQVSGYLLMLAHPIPPRRASDPSPGPRRLVKAPVAVHPLPLGEGKDPIPSLSPRERSRRQRWDRCVQRNVGHAQQSGRVIYWQVYSDNYQFTKAGCIQKKSFF
jgi:hypothetical protein